MSVGAQVRRDEDVVGRGRGRCEVLREQVEVYDVCVAARGVVDDRVEVDERVVAGRVLVGSGRGLGVVRLADPGVAAFGCLARGIRAHALVVVPPGEPRGVELIGDRLDVGGEDAPLADRLPVAADHVRLEVVVAR